MTSMLAGSEKAVCELEAVMDGLHRFTPEG